MCTPTQWNSALICLICFSNLSCTKSHFLSFFLPYPIYTFFSFSSHRVVSCTLVHSSLLSVSPTIHTTVSRSHFSLPDLFPSPFFPPYYIFPQPLIDAYFIQLFFTYSFGVTFLSRGTYFFLSLSPSLAHAINVSDCAILRRVKDMRRLSNRSIDSIWIYLRTSLLHTIAQHTHTHTLSHLKSIPAITHV